MKEQLRAYLRADAGIAALVGPRVTWAWRARGSALPAICLTQISGIRNYALSHPSGLVQARVQIDCWAENNKSAASLAAAVNRLLGGLHLDLGGVMFQGIFLDNEQDLSEAGSPPNEMIHRVSQDYIIWHTE